MKKRPFGITLLAVLHFLGGVLLLGTQVVMLSNFERLSSAMSEAGIPPVLFVGSVLLITAVALVSGVGMLIGTRWGWWTGAFYYVFSIARNANALATVSVMSAELEATDRGAEYYYLKFALRIAIHLLLLMYLMKPRVLAYFGLEDLHKAKAIGKLIGAVGTIFGLASVFS